MGDSRVGVVVITWERRDEALACVERLLELPEQPHVVLVDNGSTDGTADAVRDRFPTIEVVALSENLGAVGRNIGVRLLRTPYVAFCDDDTWWGPGSLAAAADALDACPGLALVNARIVVEPSGVEDPIVAELRDSPVPGPDWLPGPALGSFLAGASVLRRDAFEQAGGFSERLWLGGEEELLATDLLSAGWEICYLEELTVHHRASLLRDATHRRRVGVRNTLWFTWLRRPLGPALRRTLFLAGSVPRDRTSLLGAWDAARGIGWLLANRRPRPAEVEARLSVLDETQRRSTARRYVG
ncbi:putative glycosyltransferase [Actinoplanes missouriensis 431]|uniref:Putative glycosyltransferase n=1 Tax=Actinoplanes missouriensis (strain ATCC 14538 / DSM 43046 / CBS 188.64 / JCM 3121 / NBRC 102363 / NCIMB 12654 / NRRL B-3342 / UNCC 431) TaxID=512565 RepID=I0GZZ9_ACTM4|nr:glycosyltransferase [Actinoplanes missouriensis]BAL86336.1 putative glycosyltransferase [Actinoplanes missouriensis 431]